MSPKISVLMPVYNNKLYVEKAIRSILNQSYEDWELIIINDKSTDGVDVILDKYKDHEKIKIIKNMFNKGCYVSLNKGIKKSEGEYIARVDSDDYIHKDKLKLQIELMEKDDCDIVFCNSRTTKTNCVIHRCMGAALIKKTVFDKIGYFDSVRIAADAEFKARYIKTMGTNKIGKIRKILYFITERPDSLCRSASTGMGSSVRYQYKQSFKKWHNSGSKLYIDYPLYKRKFIAPKKIT